MSLAFDEFGRPFIIIREQEMKKRTKGMEAHKVSMMCNCESILLPKVALLLLIKF